jgi:hypothetical protein
MFAEEERRRGPGQVTEPAEPMVLEAAKDRLPGLVLVLTMVIELAWFAALIFGIVWLLRLILS